MSQLISRRTVLRGVGTAVALPLLEAMLPLSALAQSATGRVRPVRMAFVFVPNGIHMPAWTPAAEGTAFALPSILEPLEKVRKSLTILSGLAQLNARSLGDGGGDHARSAAAWLTGCHPSKQGIKNNISVDQLAARKIGHLTRFPSMEIGIESGRQAGSCDTGYSCAYSSCISWRGETTPVAKDIDPRAVFERMFGNDHPGETARSRVRRDLYNRSILDLVMEDANRLRGRLGAHDRDKLDEYFTSVREIEQRLRRVGNDSGALPESAGMDAPMEVPAEYGEHVRLMADMMVLAFQADLTRIGTFMFANEGSNHSYTSIGISDGHHELSHHGGLAEKQEKIRQINRFHVQQLAYLLEKMQSIQEPGGTLLDNSMIVYGGGISDGNRHNHDDLPILVAGRGGGTIRSGRHVRYERGTPMTNLFISMLDRMGIPAEKIGDSTGRLQQLI